MKAFCAAALIVLMPVSAYAFAGREHRRITSNAYDLAEAYIRAKYPNRFTSADDSVLRAFRGQLDLSYAGLVVAIDHAVDPLRVLERAVHDGTLPASTSELDSFVLKSVVDPRLSGLRAVSVNDMHFQAQLTANLRLYHLFAVNLAAQGDQIADKSPDVHASELFTALAVNTITDHLLQDFFAPGHIITPRYGIHDAVAMYLHDKYNILGSYFTIEAEKYEEELKPFLEHLPANTTSRAFIGATRAHFEAGDAVPLWGDGNLHRSPRQELLLTLLTARSIADVLESYVTGVAKNSFRDVAFHAAYRAAPYAARTEEEIADCPPHEKLHLATATLPYGAYKHPCAYQGKPHRPLVLGVSLGSEALYQAGEVSTRYVVGVDSFIVGTNMRSRDDGTGRLIQRPREQAWAATIGYSYGRNHVQAQHGVSVRGIMAMPLIHTQLGLQLNGRRYSLSRQFTETDQPRSSTRFGWCVNVQTGFSFLKFDLGAGRDFAFRDGRLQRATLVRTGAYLELPGTLLGMKSRLRKRRVIPDDPK